MLIFVLDQIPLEALYMYT